MDYVVTENQKNKMMMSFLDMMTFIITKGKDEIFLVESEDDKLAQMVYQTKSKKLYINQKVVNSLCNFFSQENSYACVLVIMHWFEKKYEVKVSKYWVVDSLDRHLLSTSPYNSRTKQ